MIVYLAGPITGVKDYKHIFNGWEKKLSASGHLVLNPARLPKGMPLESYMPICMAMIDQADTVALLPGWEESKGALLERTYAVYQGKVIMCI